MAKAQAAAKKAANVNHSKVIPIRELVISLDDEIAQLQARLDELRIQKEFQEFQKDPAAFKAKLLAEATSSFTHERPNEAAPKAIYSKPGGSHRPLEILILDIFRDFPTREFSAGLMTSELIDRGWKTRDRSPKQAVSMKLSAMHRADAILKPHRGVYKYKAYMQTLVEPRKSK